MCERFTCKPFKKLRKKLVDRDVPENRITSYLVETCEITSGRARGLMKKEYQDVYKRQRLKGESNGT